MTDEMKALLGFQQGELDAVALYTAMAKVTKDEEMKLTLTKMAADEGKHARILKEYTDTVLKPKNTMKNFVVPLYRIAGKKPLFKFMAKFEYDSTEKYQPYIEKYPNIAEIAADETRHGNLLIDMMCK